GSNLQNQRDVNPALTHTLTFRYMHTNTHPYTDTCIYTHTHIHTHTHTHTRNNTHIHANNYTYKENASKSLTASPEGLHGCQLTMLISDMVSMLAMSKLIPTVTGPSVRGREPRSAGSSGDRGLH